jgi:SAM-dependent methyltransferase
MPPKRSDKTRVFEKALSVLDLAPGSECQVLDFGSGKGEFLGHLSQLVGKNSELIGIDAMENSIAQAKRDYPSVEFICDKFIDRLSFPDASFDVVTTIDTIECIRNKGALINEIHRVLKPRGKVLAMHWDWDTQVYNSEHKEIIRRFVVAYSDWQQGWMDTADGQMGRKLWGLFQGSSMFDGRVEVFSLIETEYRQGKYGHDRLRDLAGLVEKRIIDKSDYDLILSEMEQLDKNRRYFYSVNSYLYCGTRT